jgi:outer membrane murein-binding lipoprotein Lpp
MDSKRYFITIALFAAILLAGCAGPAQTESAESLRQTKYIEALIAQLKDKNENARVAAIAALGTSKDSRALEPLVALLKDGNCYIRCAAAGALGDLGDSRAIESLISALNDQIHVVFYVEVYPLDPMMLAKQIVFVNRRQKGFDRDPRDFYEAVLNSLDRIGLPTIDYLNGMMKEERTKSLAVFVLYRMYSSMSRYPNLKSKATEIVETLCRENNIGQADESDEEYKTLLANVPENKEWLLMLLCGKHSGMYDLYQSDNGLLKELALLYFIDMANILYD